MILRFWLVALMLVCTGSAISRPLLVFNVNGYTLADDGTLQRFAALLVDEGRIVATGDAATLRERAPDARSHDGQGRTLLPGMIDAHGHVMGLGWSLQQVELSSTPSLDAALEAVRAYAAAHPEAVWITGRGWNQVIWKLGRFPTADELDHAVSDRPVWLARVDGHAGWANRAALALAGIDAETPDPAGGRIERDSSGRATGILIDAAMDLVQKKIPPADATQSRAALDAALAEMARVGITSVHDAGIDAETFTLFRAYADAGKLSARLYAMIDGVGAEFDRIAVDGPVVGYGNDHLTVRSVKLYTDGALGSRGAALLAPYSDDPHNHGLLFHDRDTLTAMLGKALSRGYQVNVHAIGDGGNRQVLDAFSLAYKAWGGRELRNRIEHAQVVTLEDIPRFLPLQLIASMQPTHATSDMNMAEDRVGPDRIHGAYAWQRFLGQGTRIAAGSDFPVELANPFFGLHAAITRQDHESRPEGGWYPAQRLSLEQAFRAFTVDAAHAAHQEDVLGTLTPGKWADFIIVDRDIFAIPPEDVWRTGVVETWVGGQKVFPH
ncbi:amidohydrolase [Xanthomonadaceae bacterium JHOS43]|nr:amidohydrolase [Xanthomonadaceae bacterium JHOS43]